MRRLYYLKEMKDKKFNDVLANIKNRFKIVQNAISRSDEMECDICNKKISNIGQSRLPHICSSCVTSILS